MQQQQKLMLLLKRQVVLYKYFETPCRLLHSLDSQPRPPASHPCPHQLPLPGHPNRRRPCWQSLLLPRGRAQHPCLHPRLMATSAPT